MGGPTLSVNPFSAARATLSLLRGAISANFDGELKVSRDRQRRLATGFAARSTCKSQNKPDPPKKFWSGLILSGLSWREQQRPSPPLRSVLRVQVQGGSRPRCESIYQ